MQERREGYNSHGDVRVESHTKGSLNGSDMFQVLIRPLVGAS